MPWRGDMVGDLKRLLGEGPYPFPDYEEDNPLVHIYHGAGAAIIKSYNEMYLPKGIHTHNSYEFTIPFTNMPPSYAGSRTVYFERNKLLPFNANQEHGPTVAMDKCNLLGLQVDQTLFSTIAYSICGKQEVVFQNECAVPDKELFRCLSQYIEETTVCQTGYEFVIQGLVSQIAVSLLRQLKSNISPYITECNYYEKDGINRAISVLRENYNKEYSLESVAQTANLSPYHFIRVFKSTTGKTPYNYLLDIKVENACLLLKNNKMSVTETCFLCGFNNLEHFAAVFKRKTGMLPSQYKKIYT
jgi:AraC-like DNA-binding protein